MTNLITECVKLENQTLELKDNKMEIRLIKKSEVKILRDFIDTFWKKNHILATKKEVLDWQYYNGMSYNFVGGFVDGELKTILGFIPKQHFDLKEKNHIWLAIWCKSVDCPKGLGVKCLDWLEAEYKPDIVSAIGINDNIERLYLNRGWKSGILNHWYFVTPGNIAKFDNKEKIMNHEGKSMFYYGNRFFNNRFYQYHQNNGIIFRVADLGDYSFIVIVDMIPEAHLTGYGLKNLLKTYECEHISCLNYGIPDSYFQSMGFQKKPKNLMLPIWTEPLDYSKTFIKFAYKSNSGERFVAWKGDADQDRINKI